MSFFGSYWLLLPDFSFTSFLFSRYKWRVIRWLGKERFQLSQNVLDTVYGQTLVWGGMFYAPLLPLLYLIFIFITFYIKKVRWQNLASDFCAMKGRIVDDKSSECMQSDSLRIFNASNISFLSFPCTTCVMSRKNYFENRPWEYCFTLSCFWDWWRSFFPYLTCWQGMWAKRGCRRWGWADIHTTVGDPFH